MHGTDDRVLLSIPIKHTLQLTPYEYVTPFVTVTVHQSSRRGDDLRIHGPPIFPPQDRLMSGAVPIVFSNT